MVVLLGKSDLNSNLVSFQKHAPGARVAPPKGWWSCSFISFHIILVYFI
jgi:hypothetical protein